MTPLTATALLLSALPTKGAQAEEPVATTPYKVHPNNWIAIEVMANGQGPFDFKVDTGAGPTHVYQSLEDEVGFEATGKEISMVTVNGVERMPGHVIPELSISDDLVLFENLESFVAPDWKAAGSTLKGVIGRDAMKDYILVFHKNRDDDRGRLDIYPADQGPNESSVQGWKKFHLNESSGEGAISKDNPFYTLEGVINNHATVTFKLDTGASGTTINNAAFDNIKDGRNRCIKNVEADVAGSGNTIRGRLREFDSLAIDGHVWEDAQANVIEFKVFETIGPKDEAVGLLGADLFQGCSFMLDFSRNEMRVDAGQCEQSRARPSRTQRC